MRLKKRIRDKGEAKRDEIGVAERRRDKCLGYKRRVKLREENRGEKRIRKKRRKEERRVE